MVSSRKPARVIWASAKSQKTWIRNNRFRNAVYFLLGLSRSPPPRTLYNASRPFSVMGGLSDKEVEFLQKARGPEAQMALCLIWLKEFVSREHLDGSTGKVAPPIVARVYQFISDGFVQYNQCRKTAYTQFPFVHSQLTTFFLFVSIFFPVFVLHVCEQYSGGVSFELCDAGLFRWDARGGKRATRSVLSVPK
ncbi:hypothetical protein IV203_015808 [Nitzschia inconspicua]|uniref:Uncharacterized protein n=1 Tax=Nitzschia inconspicua TaxID=303405 RepID=A0A9K3PVZ6_9STRA|nr:hypothetical protein IV203_015808 [Nitzschia inconspicua]